MSYLGRSAKLSLKAQEKVSFLATAGQTSKTGLSYTPSFVEVYVNGVLLTDTTDFTATNGNSVTFTVALLLNDEVTVISLKTFSVADHYSKTEADTLLAAKSPLASPSFTGNVGVGVVPEAWNSTFDAIQIGDQASIFGQNSGTQSGFAHNMYFDGAYKYITTSQASRYVQSGGSHVWSVAPSGTADAAISWTTAMTIDNAGRVTTPSQPYFAAYMDTGGSWVSTNADIALPFNNTDVNIGGHFNTSNYRFTAPVVGVYAFSAGFITNQTAGLGRMMFWINGVAKYSHIQYGMNGSDATGAGSSMATAFIKLAANDYVDFRSQSGTIVAYQSQHSSFTGYLLG